jgi:zinc transport system substrate-binding protein
MKIQTILTKNSLKTIIFSFLFITSQSFASTVVTTIKPLQALIQSVAGEANKVELLIKSGSAHIHSLKPSQLRLLNNASVVFYLDDHFETFLPKTLDNLKDKTKVFAIARNLDINLLKAEEHHHDEHEGHEEHDGHEEHKHEEEHHHDHDEHKHHEEHHKHDDKDKHDDHADKHHAAEEHHYDLHIWFDPQIAQKIVKFVANKLSETYPQNKAIYQANAEKTLAELDNLDAKIRREFKTNNKFIIFHNAYNYFLRSYHLEDSLKTQVNNHNLTIKEVLALKNLIKNDKVSCIFSDNSYPQKIITKLTSDTKVKYYKLDPLGYNIQSDDNVYNELIQNLASALNQCD